MATFYLDLEGGNDANAGTSYALRWKTFTSGATAARIAPGDTIRVMASPDEALVGNATWTANSSTVTLAAAVTATVDDCNSSWVASANVTCTADSGAYKMGGLSSKFVIASGFTTGLAAYISLPGTLNESADVGAHRYWRLLISANNGDATYCNFGELELIDATDVDQTGSGTPTADSAQAAGTWPVTNLFDNNVSNFFAFGTGSTYPHWVAYDFGSGVTKNIVKFKMTSGIAGGAVAAQQPRDFALQYSDDGSTWFTSWDESGISGWVAETRTFTKPTVDESQPKDFSGYQQISFWMRNDTAIADGATLSLRLCSDLYGVTTVDTIALPAVPSTGQWVAVTVNKGSALGSSINSVALYCDKDPGTMTLYLDNIIACEAPNTTGALTLTSVIGKVWNRCWAASTTYAANDIRKPTQPNRNGFRYKVTAGGGGSSGSSEPAWPTEVGVTVADGALTWTCEGIEDGWYGIQSINGATIKLDAGVAARGDSTFGCYQGATETVATYSREPIKMDMLQFSFSTPTPNYVQDSGTAASPITFSGGWNRTDMSTQTGETWASGQNGFGHLLGASNKDHLAVSNLNAVRFNNGFTFDGTGLSLTLANLQAGHCSTSGVYVRGIVTMNGVVAVNNVTYGIFAGDDYTILNGRALVANGTVGSFPQRGLSLSSQRTRLNYVNAKGNNEYGVVVNNSDRIANTIINNLTTANNSTAVGVSAGAGPVFMNYRFSETNAFPTTFISPNRDGYLYSHNHNGTAGSHLITTDGGSIVSATDQRHTASGLAWKFRPTATTRHSRYPLNLPLAKLACSAGVAKSVTIWTRRDNTNIKGALRILGGQIAGVPDTVSVACEPTINTWTQSSSLTFTPTEAGVVEIVFQVWDGVGTTNNYWIDDLAIS